jgi:hypothetical protein
VKCLIAQAAGLGIVRALGLKEFFPADGAKEGSLQWQCENAPQRRAATMSMVSTGALLGKPLRA